MAGMVIATQNLVTKTANPGEIHARRLQRHARIRAFQQGLRKFPQIPVQRLFPLHPGQGPTQAYNDKELEFKITSMVQLSEMRDTMIKEMYIQLAIEDITREMIEELTHRIKESEGSTTLRVNVYDRDAQVSVNMFSKRHKVSLTSNLVSFLEDNEIKYTIV